MASRILLLTLPPQPAPRVLVLLVETAVTAGVTVATAGAATAEVVLHAATTAQPSNYLTRYQCREYQTGRLIRAGLFFMSFPACFMSFPA